MQWREVILLAVGRLVYVNLEVDRPLLLALALSGDERAGGEAHLQHVLFAAEVLLEIGIDRVLQVTQSVEIVDCLRHWLIAAMDDPAMPRGRGRDELRQPAVVAPSECPEMSEVRTY